MRNAYGRNVYQGMWLPYSSRPQKENWIDSGTDGDDEPVSFTGDINEWMAVGGDFRSAYIYIRPDDKIDPNADRAVINTFFLMQADLYHSMRLNEHVSFVLDVGIYSGFEAWGLFSLKDQPSSWDLMFKVGRFMPAFGIRDVEHQLFTREGIGLGNADRDTGVEMTAFMGAATLNVALLNGTFGEVGFDNAGADRKALEKALASRLSLRAGFGPVKLSIGGSLYFNQNTSFANPLFARAIDPALAGEAAQGVDELRAGGFLTASLGRFTYLADVVMVKDSFTSDMLDDVTGYASYQELSFIPVQGFELISMFEFMDPDIDVTDNAIARGGLAVEFFPWRFTEFRAMVRRTIDDNGPTGGAWDLVFFTHLFM
jgi:hypothetical protein